MNEVASLNFVDWLCGAAAGRCRRRSPRSRLHTPPCLPCCQRWLLAVCASGGAFLVLGGFMRLPATCTLRLPSRAPVRRSGSGEEPIPWQGAVENGKKLSSWR